MPEQWRYTTLFESPDYHLSRATFRLTRSLTNGKHDVAPYTASMMEPIVNPRLAVGDYINTVVYAARRIEVDIEEIARANIDKLVGREINGKS
jgi:hypothetical protein